MEKKITIGNVCFIKDPKENKILFLKRNREPMKNKFTGVGGKTNFSEDIYDSCRREAKEETGLLIEPKLKGVIKTILEDESSSWILFVFAANKELCPLSYCNEGELQWISFKEIEKIDLIGFIKKLVPFILDEKSFFHGTIKHDLLGNVISENIKFDRV
jgi:8-oxo-dGTP diphosphatase